MILYPQNYCVFDFETSGLDPKNDRILQIGALKVINGKQEQCSWLIKYEYGFKVFAKITEITGIDDAMIDLAGMNMYRAWNEFVEFARDLPMIGHNIIRFDIPFLSEMQHKIKDDTQTFDINKLIKSCVDTAGMFKAKKLNFDRFHDETLYEFWKRALEVRVQGFKYNVGVVCDELKISRQGVRQHRAEGDVFLTNEIYKKLCLSR